MAAGGPRWPNPIRRLFAAMSQVLSLLTNALRILSRIERATAPAGTRGINQDAWLGRRALFASAYKKAIDEFVAWCSVRHLDFDYPSEIDRAVVQSAQQTRMSRGRLRLCVQHLSEDCPLFEASCAGPMCM